MNPIHVTKNAWNKMTKIINQTKNTYGFIYSASSGGCNGFNFELNLLEKTVHDTLIKEKYLSTLSYKNTNLFIDPSSELYLLGTTIDYVSEDYSNRIFESKFLFEINKDIMTSCGCGISFSPKGI
jgi:iron-sulfur cluster assembly accessory protein